jgi:hypothetical protein
MGCRLNDMVKSGFGLRTLGRSITPAVTEAVTSIPIKNAHKGNGLLPFISSNFPLFQNGRVLP